MLLAMIKKSAFGLAALLALSAPPAAAQPAAMSRLGGRGSASSTPAPEWTESPGAFEQSLLRRYANPLYPPSRREVTPDELKAAIIRDAADARQVLNDFLDLALEHGRMARLEDLDQIRAARSRFDELIRTAMGVGGQASKLAAELRKIRSQLLGQWRERNAQSPLILAMIVETETELARHRALEQNGFVAQLLRKDGPIPQGDQASALLSEDTRTIALAMSKLDSKRRNAVRRDSRAVQSYLQFEGVEIAGFDARLRALSGGDPSKRPR